VTNGEAVICTKNYFLCIGVQKRGTRLLCRACDDMQNIEHRLLCRQVTLHWSAMLYHFYHESTHKLIGRNPVAIRASRRENDVPAAIKKLPVHPCNHFDKRVALQRALILALAVGVHFNGPTHDLVESAGPGHNVRNNIVLGALDIEFDCEGEVDAMPDNIGLVAIKILHTRIGRLPHVFNGDIVRPASMLFRAVAKCDVPVSKKLDPALDANLGHRFERFSE